MMSKRETENFYKNEGYQARRLRLRAVKKKIDFLEKQSADAACRQTRLIKKYLKSSMILCDIGASKGYFLSQAKKYVKQVVAIEPGEEEQNHLRSKGILYYPWLERISDNNLIFDLATMFHLFEHLRRPVAYLNELRRRLRPGALVIVEVPNIDDVLVSRYNCAAFKKFYFQSMHCFYYNEETLSSVFMQAGFKKIKCHYLQRYPLSNHLQWLLNGLPGGNEMYERRLKGVNKRYIDILAKEKITDTIICVFQLK